MEGEEAVRKSRDTLDVWIDSGSSSRSVTLKRDSLRGSATEERETYQAHLYLEGSDQHRGWFQSSLLLSLGGNGAAPYQSVLTHGFMVDADREKISKSKQGQGGYSKPQTSEAYIKDYGADIVRLWVASQDFRNDIVVSADRIKKVGETYRGIRNAFRYQLSNLFDFDPSKHQVADEDLSTIDRWILWRLAEVRQQVLEAYDRYEFHSVYQKLGQFAAVDLSAIFHDVVKDRLYTLSAKDPKRRSTQTALYRLVKQLSQLLSPILVFTSDEVWESIPGNSEDSSIHVSDLEKQQLVPRESETEQWTALFALRDRVLMELEEKRRAKDIGKALEAIVVIRTDDEAEKQLATWGEDLRELLNVSHVEFMGAEAPVQFEYNGKTVLCEEGAGIAVFPAKGFDLSKCGRCWHWEGDIGQTAEHPTLCGRCVEAVEKNTAQATTVA